MIRAKEVSAKNIVIFLMLSLAATAGFYLTRPRVTAAKSAPVFFGEEVIVQRAATAAVAKTAATVVASPVVPPKVAASLPIVPPSITFKVLPVYPAAALEKGREGAVLLSVYVGPAGVPEKVEMRTSSGISELDDAAAKAVSQWRFSPATQGGTALASWLEIPVRFQIK